MIVDPNKIQPALLESLQKDIANSLEIKADSLTITGVVIELHPGSYDLEQAEKRVLLQAYVNAGGSISKTALLLGVTRKTVYHLLKKHKVDSLININV